MKLKLPDNISSRQDLQALILEIRQYARWATQAGLKKRLSTDEPPPQPTISETAISLIKQSAEEPVGLEELVRTLDDLAVSAPVMVITLAAPVPGGLKKTLVGWCRENIDPNVLVDFDYNSTILGGLVVRYGSHVHDWSFRRQIMAALDKFPEILRNV